MNFIECIQNHMILINFLAVFLWSKNSHTSNPSLTQYHRQVERLDKILQEIQANQQSGQNQSLAKDQLARIETKIYLILQEF